MHYANGRAVKIGDKVVGHNGQHNPISGIVVGTNDSGACNLAVIDLPAYVACSQSAKNFLHVEDAFPKSDTTPGDRPTSL